MPLRRARLLGCSVASSGGPRRPRLPPAHSVAPLLLPQFSGDLAKMLHPGGTPPLLEVAGTDATETFFGLHRAEILQDPRFAKLKIGELAGGEGAAAASGEAAVLYAESLGFWRKSSP